jgi:TRAP-type C4-dicarboxylate transport system permease small subunit
VSGTKVADYVIKALLALAVLALIVVATVIVLNILGRTFFGAPILGTIEYAGVAAVIFAAVAVPFVEKEHRNVIMEVVCNRFPPRMKAFTDAFVLLLSLGAVGVMTWAMFREAGHAASSDETTLVMRIPLAPFKYIWAVGVGLLALVILKNIIDSVRKGVKR